MIGEEVSQWIFNGTLLGVVPCWSLTRGMVPFDRQPDEDFVGGFLAKLWREAWRTQKERVQRGRQRDRVQDLLNELTLPAACLGISSLYYNYTGYHLTAGHFG